MIDQARIRALSVALLTATLALNTAHAEKPSGEAELRERVSAYWQARVEQSESIFEFYAPEARDSATEGGNIKFLEFALEGVELDGDTASVSVRTHTDFSLPPQFRNIPKRAFHPLITESWERVDGVWYKRPTGSGLGRLMQNPSKSSSDRQEAAPPADVAIENHDRNSEEEPNG